MPRLGEFKNELDVDEVIKNGRHENSKITFICNPGNPSSTSVSVEQVKDVLEGLKDDCMVVIDEAYIEFANHESFVGLVGQYSNLIVLRTLSKSYGFGWCAVWLHYRA